MTLQEIAHRNEARQTQWEKINEGEWEADDELSVGDAYDDIDTLLKLLSQIYDAARFEERGLAIEQIIKLIEEAK